MEYVDNPAGRLHFLLRQLKDTGNPQHVTTTDAWWRVLGHAAPVDSARLLESLAKVMDLATDARVRLERLDDVDTELFLKWQGKVDAALGASLTYASSPVSNVLERYDDTTLAQLEHTSYELHRRAPEHTMAEERLAELRTMVQAVLDDVLGDNDLDVTLRGYAAEHLRSLLDAFDEYKIRGVEALTDAVDRAYGHVVRDPQMQVVIATHPTKWEKLRDTFSAVAAAATIATSTLQLTAAPHDGPGPSQITIVNVSAPNSAAATPPTADHGG